MKLIQRSSETMYISQGLGLLKTLEVKPQVGNTHNPQRKKNIIVQNTNKI